ncbi:hypothetical protein GOV06_00530 [Candidatus Woesearchaeota archaeon]|nr:hypothetical protein [Candidatus Woesearchaeota archaeon]
MQIISNFEGKMTENNLEPELTGIVAEDWKEYASTAKNPSIGDFFNNFHTKLPGGRIKLPGGRISDYGEEFYKEVDKVIEEVGLNIIDIGNIVKRMIKLNRQAPSKFMAPDQEWISRFRGTWKEFYELVIPVYNGLRKKGYDYWDLI